MGHPVSTNLMIFKFIDDLGMSGMAGRRCWVGCSWRSSGRSGPCRGESWTGTAQRRSCETNSSQLILEYFKSSLAWFLARSSGAAAACRRRTAAWRAGSRSPGRRWASSRGQSPRSRLRSDTNCRCSGSNRDHP